MDKLKDSTVSMTVRGNLPEISRDLLEELETRFPDKCPDPRMTEKDIYIKMGEVRVIRFLRAEFEIQNQSVLGDP